jgi:hypothetical protein
VDRLRAGEVVERAGTATTDRTCAACESGTFTTDRNTDTCIEWSDCAPGTSVASDGTATSAYSDHTCGLRQSDQQVVCWGDDGFGQVSQTPAGVAFESVSAGRVHTCGIRSDGTRTCWGAFLTNPRR